VFLRSGHEFRCRTAVAVADDDDAMHHAARLPDVSLNGDDESS
jgi:hypothetical protein